MAKNDKSNETANKVLKNETPAQFKIKEVISKVIFRWQDNVQRAFKVTGPIEVTMLRAQFKKEKYEQDVIPVVDLNSGQTGLLIANTELKDKLEDAEGGYVGKCFVATRLPRSENTRGRSFFLAEIEEPAK